MIEESLDRTFLEVRKPSERLVQVELLSALSRQEGRPTPLLLHLPPLRLPCRTAQASSITSVLEFDDDQ